MTDMAEDPGSDDDIDFSTGISTSREDDFSAGSSTSRLDDSYSSPAPSSSRAPSSSQLEDDVRMLTEIFPGAQDSLGHNAVMDIRASPESITTLAKGSCSTTMAAYCKLDKDSCRRPHTEWNKFHDGYKSKKEFDRTADAIKVPLQGNGSDCGAHTIYNMAWVVDMIAFFEQMPELRMGNQSGECATRTWVNNSLYKGFTIDATLAVLEKQQMHENHTTWRRPWYYIQQKSCTQQERLPMAHSDRMYNYIGTSLAVGSSDLPLRTVAQNLEPQQIFDRVGAVTGEPPETLLRMAGRDPGRPNPPRPFRHPGGEWFSRRPGGERLKAAKDAAQASVQLLSDNPTATTNTQVKRPPSAGGSSDNLPGPASPGRRRRGSRWRAYTRTALTGMIWRNLGERTKKKTRLKCAYSELHQPLCKDTKNNRSKLQEEREAENERDAALQQHVDEAEEAAREQERADREQFNAEMAYLAHL
uniref:Uncharacterized protein n=1 Tax=Branchiostoma floridae TaxID=7739 RepID=C3Z183_BRAFL|eukprot:XP_002597770.1 hypothetical protein BRAFLDRAFT_77327 [Branchiostoma floridae]